MVPEQIVEPGLAAILMEGVTVEVITTTALPLIFVAHELVLFVATTVYVDAAV